MPDDLVIHHAGMIEVILTDIEGTTTADFFVKEVLFGYARKRIRRYFTNGKDDPVVQEHLQAVRDAVGEPEADVKQVIKTLQEWIDADRKEPILKTIQGILWEDGYRTQQYLGHIFPDVHRNLVRWQAKGLKLYIYSSGSVPAQQLLFEHTSFGDTRHLLSGYFDTAIGPKREVPSYQAIAEAIGVAADKICFLSDIMAELDAAREAGMRTIRLVREEEADTGDDAHPFFYDFDEVQEWLVSEKLIPQD